MRPVNAGPLATTPRRRRFEAPTDQMIWEIKSFARPRHWGTADARRTQRRARLSARTWLRAAVRRTVLHIRAGETG